MTRLTALLVNHRSGAFALRAIESLQAEWSREGRAEADLEVVVVDSGSGAGEATWLRSLRHLGAQVVEVEENVGYARGLNLAYQRSRGEGEVVALLNPDLYFLPGALGPLLERLEAAPQVTMVAPRCYVDEARALALPPNCPPSPADELLEALAQRVPALGRWRAARRSRRAATWWGSETPIAADMLSGACLFLRRETVEALGAPMDGGYPLYFEDADLCARLARSGGRLELEPRSEVLHHWSRSAGPEFAGEVARRWATSRARYRATHHGGPLASCAGFLQALIERFGPRGGRALHEVEDLGTCHEPPTFELGRRGSWQLEVSLTPHFGLSAGALFEGESFALPARTWSWLFPAVYHARVLDAESFEVVAAWTFHKASAARSWPLDPASAPRPRRATRPTPGRGERVG